MAEKGAVTHPGGKAETQCLRGLFEIGNNTGGPSSVQIPLSPHAGERGEERLERGGTLPHPRGA